MAKATIVTTRRKFVAATTHHAEVEAHRMAVREDLACAARDGRTTDIDTFRGMLDTLTQDLDEAAEEMLYAREEYGEALRTQ